MSAEERGARGAYGDGDMTFEEIAGVLGCSHQAVIQSYQRAMRKLARDAYAIEILREWSEYNHQLRARSAECRAAQEHW